MFKKIIKKRKVRYFRFLMKGYRNLRETGLLSSVNQIKRDFTNIGFEKNAVSKSIFGEASGDAELVYRQFLLMRISSENLSKAILYAYSKESLKLAYPLPRHWQKIIESYGFRVSRIKCSVLWCMYILYTFLNAIILINKTAVIAVYKIIFSNKKPLENYVFFEDLTLSNLPKSNIEKDQLNIISWYMQWPNRVKEIKTICHSVSYKTLKLDDNISLVSISSASSLAISFSGLVKYVCWGISVFFIACISLMRGHWWNVLMLGEASKAACIRLQDSKNLASEYLFHNSHWMYRPLWTYEAEKKGSLITFYFYATNVEGFKRSSEDDSYKYYYGYQSMNWPRYLVWDKGQADFIHRIDSGSAEVEIVGDIWFRDSKHKSVDFPKNSVAIFDVQPVRDYYYQTLCVDFDYYTPENCNQFVSDIYEELSSADYQLMLKQKRDIGKLTHSKYTKNLAQLSKKPNFNFVDSEINPIKIIESAEAVISMPFSSTALLARNLGKSSIYYDPLGKIKKDDRASHGIPIVSGREELETWINSVL